MGDSTGGGRNALGRSRSPYLLQHATNPVDWKEWGEEAFAEAKRRDVPIFLSIGYSTCHWCHVMARESFEDEETASLLNERFVTVKLDREERPDVDRIYMSYVQATTGSGGWPMSVWLTPDLKPFYGGTYFPPEDRYGRVGFKSLIKRIGDLWANDRATLLEYGEKSQQLLTENASQDLTDEITGAARAVDQCLGQLEADFDSEYGGFGGAPKFPMPAYFALLEEGLASLGNRRLEEMLGVSLEKMAAGGIWDHVGGGFHRYSVDRYWHVPHYEKMLYDQGQLAAIYAEAYRLTGTPSFAAVAKAIVGYVERDLTGARGELFAAEDADSPLPDDPSEHGEGAFYVWRSSELEALLGPDARLFAAAFNIKPNGNARPESDPHGELKGLNTLTRVQSDEELASTFELSAEAVASHIQECLKKVFEARSKRPRPHLDDKAIVSWSALMITGACKVYQACGDEKALALARNAGQFVFEEMWDEGDRSFRRVYRKSRGEALGFAEDYAAMANACLDLYECDFDVLWLERAKMVVGQLRERFEDADRGGFYATEADDRAVIVRLRDDYDGAEPAASSLAALALLRLGAILDNAELRALARRTIEAFGGQWSRAPRAMCLMLVAASRFLTADQQIVVVGGLDQSGTRDLLRVANRWRKPHSALMALDPKSPLPEVFSGNEKLRAMVEANNDEEVRVYVCENYTCAEPTSDPAALETLLQASS